MVRFKNNLQETKKPNGPVGAEAKLGRGEEGNFIQCNTAPGGEKRNYRSPGASANLRRRLQAGDRDAEARGPQGVERPRWGPARRDLEGHPGKGGPTSGCSPWGPGSGRPSQRCFVS